MLAVIDITAAAVGCYLDRDERIEVSDISLKALKDFFIHDHSPSSLILFDGSRSRRRLAASSTVKAGA
jgi:hypothetical protein